MMQAIVLDRHGGSEGFQLRELPAPKLRPGDVLVSVTAVGFNPVDYQTRQNAPNISANPSPILGRDLSGVVKAVHPDVTDLAVGDAVYSYVCNRASSGTYAELLSIPVELVAKAPASLTADQAAATPVAAITATIALTRVQASPTSSLFVAGGAGGVGTFVLALARRMGVERLVTTAGSSASRDYLEQVCGLRPEQIVDYRREEVVTGALRRNGGPFECVLDLVGGRMLAACCELVSIDGHLASVTDPPLPGDFEHLFQRNASFHAIGANAYAIPADRRQWRRYRQMLDALAQMFDAGELPPPTVQNLGAFSVETVRRAHDLLERSAVQGKLVMSGREPVTRAGSHGRDPDVGSAR